MEYRDDLKCLSWDVLYRKLIDAEQVATEYSDTIIAFGRKVRALEAELKSAQDKLAAQAPVFEVGKCYRNKKGEIRGPLNPMPERVTYVLVDQFGVMYTKKGERYQDIPSPSDLLPGPVSPPPTWTPPASLPDGEYSWSCGMFQPKGFGTYEEALRLLLGRDWTNPPREGRWKVENGTATWLGDA